MNESQRPLAETYWVVPGKFLAGEYPSHEDDEEARQRIDSLLKAGFDTFIDLTRPGELKPYSSILEELARFHERQVHYQNYPIIDLNLPTRENMLAILDTIDETLASGRRVYLHCWGGIGRTGTVVGCYLVRHGLSGEGALQQIAEWWQNVPKHLLYPNSPQTYQQVDFVLNWAEKL